MAFILGNKLTLQSAKSFSVMSAHNGELQQNNKLCRIETTKQTKKNLLIFFYSRWIYVNFWFQNVRLFYMLLDNGAFYTNSFLYNTFFKFYCLRSSYDLYITVTFSLLWNKPRWWSSVLFGGKIDFLLILSPHSREIKSFSIHMSSFLLIQSFVKL